VVGVMIGTIMAGGLMVGMSTVFSGLIGDLSELGLIKVPELSLSNSPWSNETRGKE